MNKLVVLGVLSIVSKLSVAGALVFTTFKVSPVAGLVTLAGLVGYNIVDYLIQRALYNQEAQAMTQFMQQYQKGLGGGNA